MTIAFPSGTQPPIATADAATTQATYSALPTVPPPTTTPVTLVTITANHLDWGKLQRPASPSFTMNTIVTIDHTVCVCNTLNPKLLIKQAPFN